MSNTDRIANNTTWFTLALILQKIIAFVYFTYLARLLGAVDLGHYVFALSYMQIFSIVIDFGTNHYITREIAKDNTTVQKIAGNVYGFKLLSSVVAVVLSLCVAQLLGYSADTKELLYIAAGIMIIESFIISTFAIIRGYHTLKYESIATLVVYLLLLVIGVTIARITQEVMYSLLVVLGIYLLNLVFGLLILHYKMKVPLVLYFNFIYWKKIFLTVLPFALAAGFSKIYNAFDQVALSKMAGEQVLGFYAVAYKLTFALQFLPLALVAAIYPAMSSSYNNHKEKITHLFTKSLYYLVVISLPITGLVLVFASPMIIALYTPVYSEAVMPLQVLIVSLPFLFINFPFGSLLNAVNKQKVQTINMGLALVINIILNIILIPKIGAIGAAMASSISTICLFIFGLMVVKKIVKIDKAYVGRFVANTLGATIIMCIGCVWIMQYVSWFSAVVFGVCVYLVLQFALKTISRDDLRQLFRSFKL